MERGRRWKEREREEREEGEFLFLVLFPKRPLRFGFSFNWHRRAALGAQITNRQVVLDDQAEKVTKKQQQQKNITFEGMHPTLRQVPPSDPRPSTHVTFIPSCPALMAAT